MSEAGSNRMRSVLSASSTGSRGSAPASGIDLTSAVSRPVTSLASLSGKQSLVSRQTGIQSENRMLFTGPDQTECHRVITGDRGKYVGFRPMSGEVTSEAEYLYRPCRGEEPAILMRHERVGEIGWNVRKLWRISKVGN